MSTETVAPAEFLGQEADWGTIAQGKRADILMVSADPLKDLGALKNPDGVMARGVWRNRQALDDLLDVLE
jgi:imidazolonepropionase-like amidohydrolase